MRQLHLSPPRVYIRRTVLRRVLAQAQIQRVLDEARRHHIIGSTHVSCKAAAILRCASNAGRAHLYYLHKSSSKCNQTSTSRGRTSQSCTTRKPKYYYYSPFSLNLSQTKQQNAEFGTALTGSLPPPAEWVGDLHRKFTALSYLAPTLSL